MNTGRAGCKSPHEKEGATIGHRISSRTLTRAFLGSSHHHTSQARSPDAYTVGDIDLSSYLPKQRSAELPMPRYLNDHSREGQALTLGSEICQIAKLSRHDCEMSVEAHFARSGAVMLDACGHHVSSHCNCLRPGWLLPSGHGGYKSCARRENTT